ncbi:MAG: hypothetical protein LQ341_006767 [Variospora aurantia]|nr:MAG: hypothetical protein LQ341_006767 [Variospora aurantia]
MTDLQPSSATKMARSDSGFASYHSGVEPTYRPMRPSRPSSPTSFSASHHPTPQLIHRYHQITIQRPPRAITTSRQNSTSAPIRSSNPSSRSSSSVITRPPSLHIRSHHRTRSECTNPYAFHRQSTTLLRRNPNRPPRRYTGSFHPPAAANTPPSKRKPAV